MSMERYISLPGAATRHEKRAVCVCLHGTSSAATSQIIEETAKSPLLADEEMKLFLDYGMESLSVELLIAEKILITAKKAEESNKCRHISMRRISEKPLSYLTGELRTMACCEIIFARSRDFYAVADNAGKARISIAKTAFLREKAEAAINRIINEKVKQKFRSVDKAEEIYASIRDINGKVTTDFDGYMPYFIKDKHEISCLFYEILFNTIKPCKKIILCDPGRQKLIKGLILPESKICFIPLDDEKANRLERKGEKYKIINLARFVDPDIMKRHRSQLKFLEKCEKELETKGYEAFLNASEKMQPFLAEELSDTEQKEISEISSNLASEAAEFLKNK